MIKEVLLLGNPTLYEVSQMVRRDELNTLKEAVDDLHDTLIDFKNKYGAGRAIAAPQIGVMKRLIYMYIDSPVVFINPALTDKSKDMMLVWDDCMCFPDLLVKVERHKTCSISYRDMEWKTQKMRLEGDLSELLQHEYDHLDGVLAVSRALDEQSFALRSQRELLKETLP
ncbi:MAG: peptide deformylase [Desulfobacterales bacterium]|jgi:peptide deformylase